MLIDLKVKIIKLAQVLQAQHTLKLIGKNMSTFNEEDNQTIRSLGLTMAGFLALTVFLIVLATFMV